MVILAWTLALTLIVCVACDVAGPETVPKDPGTAIDLVRPGQTPRLGCVGRIVA